MNEAEKKELEQLLDLVTEARGDAISEDTAFEEAGMIAAETLGAIVGVDWNDGLGDEKSDDQRCALLDAVDIMSDVRSLNGVVKTLHNSDIATLLPPEALVIVRDAFDDLSIAIRAAGIGR